MSRQTIATTLVHNRHFVAIVVVVLVVLAFLPGSPGQIFLAGTSSSPSPSATATPPATAGSSVARSPAPSGSPAAPPVGEDESPPVEPPLRLSDLVALEPQSREARPTCDTDDLFAAVNGIRDGASAGLGDILNQLLPGEDANRGSLPTGTLERIVRLVTGCEAEPIPENPDLAADYFTQLVVESLLDFTGLVPSTGLDPILFPPALFDITTLVFDLLTDARSAVPLDLGDLLGPAADDVREWCGTIELLLLLAPILVVQSAPLDRAQLTRLMGPIAGICGLFDDDSFLDDDA